MMRWYVKLDGKRVLQHREIILRGGNAPSLDFGSDWKDVTEEREPLPTVKSFGKRFVEARTTVPCVGCGSTQIFVYLPLPNGPLCIDCDKKGRE